jgi:hypothetical protein
MNISTWINERELSKHRVEDEGADLVMVVTLADAPFEIRIRKDHERVHTMPDEPARPATLQEAAQLIHKLNRIMTA